MRFTRASVEEIVSKQPAYKPMQIDGIPEGFSFLIESMTTIGGVYKLGTLAVFVPLGRRDDQNNMITYPIMTSRDDPTLVSEELEKGKVVILERYKKQKNGK